MWYDWWRWALLVFILYTVLSTLLMVYIEMYSGLVYFAGFFVSIGSTWVLMFFTQEQNPHFREDD